MGVQHCLLTLLPLAVTPLARAQPNAITSALAADADSTTNPISALMQNTAANDDNDPTADAAGATTTSEIDEIVTAPDYDPAQCDSWIGALPASDLDSSGGLSGPEYYSFLAGIENPPYAGAYFRKFPSYDKLPWTFRVIHKTLACHCEQMDMGPNCCEGDRAEVQVLGQVNSITRDATQEKEYRDMFCQHIAYAFSRSVPMPEPTTSPTLGPTGSPTTGAPSSSPTTAPTASPTASPMAGPSPVPSVSLKPTEGDTVEQTEEQVAAAEEPPAEVKIMAGPEPEDDGMSIGAIIGIVAAILVALLAIIAMVAYRRKTERDRLRKFAGDQAPEADLEAPPPGAESAMLPRPEPSREPSPGEGADEDDESSAPSVWSDSDHADDANADLHDAPGEDKVTAGSALAAMGAASTVTKNLMNSGTNNGSGHGSGPDESVDASSGVV